MINVLLVEDELLVRSGMRSLIDWNAHGFHLAGEAAHGEEALELLQRQRIDIMITDIRMPVMDGLQLIEKVRERNLPCEMIVLSSYDDFPYVRKAMTYGVCDYIHKPTMSIEELLGTLRRVAGSLETRRSAEAYQRLVLDAVEESREVILKKIVSQALQQTHLDAKVKELIQGIYVAEEPFWIGALRYGNPTPTALLPGAMEVQAPDQTMRALVQEVSMQAHKPVFLFHEDPVWLFLFPSTQGDLMQRVAACVEERHGVKVIWEMPDQPCRIEQLATVAQAALTNLSVRYGQWERHRTLHPQVKSVLEYISVHYSESLTLDKVSSVVHVSPVYLSRLFYRETGSTFIDWLTNYRVEQARRLLRETNLCAYEIGDKVGYRNSKYFLRVFKKLEGVTPGDFRERERKVQTP